MAKCKHDEDYEIAVDHIRVEWFKRLPDGQVEWSDGDIVPYGTFTFYCRQCGFHKWFSDKRPKWISERIAALKIESL